LSFFNDGRVARERMGVIGGIRDTEKYDDH
jgi:hypothetical protein